MPVFKLDLIMAGGGLGWRETYYRNFASPSLGNVLQVAQTLASKRAALNGFGITIEAYSITDPLTAGRQGESVPFNPPYQGFALTEPTGAAAPSASINVVWSSDVTSLHRRVWFRGIWDLAISHFNQLNSPDYGSWFAEFLKYRTYIMQQQFGWLNRPRAGRAVCSYTYIAEALVPTFTFNAPFFPVESINNFESVRFSGFNSRSSPLNRELVVEVLTTTTCRAALPIAAQPQRNVGRCIRYGTPVFLVASNIGISRVGRRAPGRPLLRTPGRSRARPRS